MSIENLNDDEIRRLKAEVKARREEVRPIYQHYGSVENLNDDEIRRLEAEVKARREEVRPIYQHYGSVENLNDDEIRILEAEVKARREEIRPTFQHYGSVENLNDDEIRILEAQVAEKRKIDIPYKEYLNQLINNPKIDDVSQFEDAVNRSMQSNMIMKDFVSNLIGEISKQTYVFKSIDKNDKVSIENQKQKIEDLVNLYVRYLYGLKKQDWNFSDLGNSIGLEMIDSDMLGDLWKVQKNFDITFNMLIPKNLGEYYGQAFERQSKMVPAITLMYDDLRNKDVNWHQVIIYKENELTPKQRYIQRREESLKQFELSRQEEIKNLLSASKTQVVGQSDNLYIEEEQQNNFLKR